MYPDDKLWISYKAHNDKKIGDLKQMCSSIQGHGQMQCHCDLKTSDCFLHNGFPQCRIYSDLFDPCKLHAMLQMEQ